MNTYAQLNIAIPTFSGKLNHLEIHSVSEYVIFDDLLRSLLKYDSNGELAPDLAESWEIKDNFTKFIFKIKSNQFFSDKSPITPKDIEKSLNAILKNPNIVHGDGNKILKITSTHDSLIIYLKNSTPFFISELASPEYRIIKHNSNYQITSGPYYISKLNHSNDIIQLKKNEYFPFNSSIKFEEVNYIKYSKAEHLNLKSIDIIWPTSTLSMSDINNILNHNFYIYKFNMGFSYWLSINPNTLNLAERIQIKNILDTNLKNCTFFDQNNLSRSNQLFLPNGPGRLTEREIPQITLDNNTTHNPIKSLKILLPKDINIELIQTIKNSFKNIVINYYTDFSDYSKLTKNSVYDIYLVNNDLSSIDLRSSISVTFNKSRPLVWIEKNNSSYNQLLENIQVEQNSTKRYFEIKKLSEKVLNDVIVYPLYYDYGYVLAKKGIDLSNLNQAGSETYSWKIK